MCFIIFDTWKSTIFIIVILFLAMKKEVEVYVLHHEQLTENVQ